MERYDEAKNAIDIEFARVSDLPDDDRKKFRIAILLECTARVLRDILDNK